jgi:alpha-L-rhamnosidase
MSCTVTLMHGFIKRWRVFVAPQVVGDLTWARADYDSARGKIISDWKVAGGEFGLKLKVPANTTATVSLPIGEITRVLEGGQPVAQSRGVAFSKEEGGRTVFLVEPGLYEFSGPLNAH